jgi:hypothetical protein
VLSRKPPYHQYTKESEVRSALSREEVPKRPSATDDDIDEIKEQFWKLILGCCVLEPGERLTLLDIQKALKEIDIHDVRPEITRFPGAEILTMRSPPDIDWDRVKRLLDQIQVYWLNMHTMERRLSSMYHRRLSFCEAHCQNCSRIIPEMWQRQRYNTSPKIFEHSWTFWMWCALFCRIPPLDVLWGLSRPSKITSRFPTSATVSWPYFQESQHQPIFSPVGTNSTELNTTFGPLQAEASGQCIEGPQTQIYVSR